MTAIDDPHPKSGEDNNMATLQHNDRVCEIKPWFISSLLWGKVLPAMQAPTLTDLVLSLTVKSGASRVPDSFVEVCTTSASFVSNGIPSPGIPNTPLSATDPVRLTLSNNHHLGYISAKGGVIYKVGTPCNSLQRNGTEQLHKFGRCSNIRGRRKRFKSQIFKTLGGAKLAEPYDRVRSAHLRYAYSTDIVGLNPLVVCSAWSHQ
jgi:hypothetical protein